MICVDFVENTLIVQKLWQRLLTILALWLLDELVMDKGDSNGFLSEQCVDLAIVLIT